MALVAPLANVAAVLLPSVHEAHHPAACSALYAAETHSLSVSNSPVSDDGLVRRFNLRDKSTRASVRRVAYALEKRFNTQMSCQRCSCLGEKYVWVQGQVESGEALWAVVLNERDRMMRPERCPNQLLIKLVTT